MQPTLESPEPAPQTSKPVVASTRRLRPCIAIDAMGGDNAPDEIVAGALLAENDGHADLVLVGDEARIRPLLGASKIRLVHAPRAVAMDDHPSIAVRMADSSLAMAIDLVRDGEADAVVSAGNSGAFLAVGLVRLRKIAGIARPAISIVMPGRKGPVVLLDAGANVDCRPEWLLQFGLMGSAYAKTVLKVDNPRVGIISVGEERTKGNAQVIDAAKLLDTAPLNFVGNIEGKDVFNGLADVVVTDGFVGNVMLKLAEGAATTIMDTMTKHVMAGGLFVKLGALLIRPALRRAKKELDYDSYGGAPLLGLRGNGIVAHGRAKREAIRNAINAAVCEAREDVIGRITDLVGHASVAD